MVGVGVVGYGYWGPNLVRAFSKVENAKVILICDLVNENLHRAKIQYPHIAVTQHFQELLNHKDIDAILIATPVQSHFELASKAIRAGKHVLVEKPIARSSHEAALLIEEAKQHQKILMVGHTFVYAPPVKKIHELIANGILGDIYFYDSTRVNLGLFRYDVDVIWDLAIHDLSIIDYVLQNHPVAISATSATHISGSPNNSAFITAFFNNNTIAHINVNWLSPVKLRRTLISGSQKMVIYDDLEVTEKIKVYDKGVEINNDPEIYQALKGYRLGDMWSPSLPLKEALLEEVEHFLECIQHAKEPITNGEMGLRMVQILEAASQSAKQRGVPIAIAREKYDSLSRS